MDDLIAKSAVDAVVLLNNFCGEFAASLRKSGEDSEVVGFKSIACYRTGLDIEYWPVDRDTIEVRQALTRMLLKYTITKKMRLADKIVNDFFVNTALRIAGECGKPSEYVKRISSLDLLVSYYTGFFP